MNEVGGKELRCGRGKVTDCGLCTYRWFYPRCASIANAYLGCE